MDGFPATPPPEGRPPNLYGMDREGLAKALAPFAPRPFHADQAYHWMYGRPETRFEAMSGLRILGAREGFAIAPGRITLSTAGLVPGIERLASERPRPRLAVSLAAADDALRGDLMPINRKYGLERLMEACRRFPLAPRERVTFEYVLLAGVNDAPQDALRIARLIRGLRAKVNVIPYNDARPAS